MDLENFPSDSTAPEAVFLGLLGAHTGCAVWVDGTPIPRVTLGPAFQHQRGSDSASPPVTASAHSGVGGRRQQAPRMWRRRSGQDICLCSGCAPPAYTRAQMFLSRTLAGLVPGRTSKPGSEVKEHKLFFFFWW